MEAHLLALTSATSCREARKKSHVQKLREKIIPAEDRFIVKSPYGNRQIGMPDENSIGFYLLSYTYDVRLGPQPG